MATDGFSPCSTEFFDDHDGGDFFDNDDFNVDNDVPQPTTSTDVARKDPTLKPSTSASALVAPKKIPKTPSIPRRVGTKTVEQVTGFFS